MEPIQPDTVRYLPSELISVGEYAEQIGRDRSAVHRFLKKEKITILKRRGPTGQTTSYIPRDAVKDLDELLEYGTYDRPRETRGDVGGRFYLIQIMPEEAPANITTGFTDNLPRRIMEYRTAWYTATVLHEWYARSSWERLLQDAIEAVPGITRSGEHFIITDIDAVIEQIETITKRLTPEPKFSALHY